MIIIQHKHSDVAGRTPIADGLEKGQIAINLTDRKLYCGDGSDFYTQCDGTQIAAPQGKGFFDITGACEIAPGVRDPSIANFTSTQETNDLYALAWEVTMNPAGAIASQLAVRLYEKGDTTTPLSTQTITAGIGLGKIVRVEFSNVSVMTGDRPSEFYITVEAT